LNFARSFFNPEPPGAAIANRFSAVAQGGCSLRRDYTAAVEIKKEWGGSLMLPDGWYGRPYDNQHSLTSVSESEGALGLILDQKLELRFEGLKSVCSRHHELVLGPFDRLRFKWEAYDDGRRLMKEYRTGEVKIVSPPG
jgi:hypothetical protein